MQDLINQYPLEFILLVLVVFIGYLRSLYKHINKKYKK